PPTLEYNTVRSLAHRKYLLKSLPVPSTLSSWVTIVFGWHSITRSLASQVLPQPCCSPILPRRPPKFVWAPVGSWCPVTNLGLSLHSLARSKPYFRTVWTRASVHLSGSPNRYVRRYDRRPMPKTTSPKTSTKSLLI